MDSQMRMLLRYGNAADLIIASKPIVLSVLDLSWNTTLLLGSVTPNITLPEPLSFDFDQEIRIIFTAAGTTASFTAPEGMYLGDSEGYAGLSTGNTLEYDVVEGTMYECSFALIDSTHIALIAKAWPTE